MEGPQPGDSERNVADHVRRERELRGWSTAELARRVTQAGCPMSQSAVWRIESGEPRRKITVDELVGFAKVFDKRIDDLLQPTSDEYPEQVVNAYAQAWVIAEDAAFDSSIKARTAFADLAAVIAAYPAALPHLPQTLDEAIERSEASHVKREIDKQLPEISRYLASKGSHDSHMDNAAPLVKYWESLGMTYEDMAIEARRLRLNVPFYSALGRLRAVYESKGSVGEKLQLAREIREQTVDQLSKITRIRPQVIEAIERDDFSLVGEENNRDVYARGHIRILARNLGLDAEPLLEQYDVERGGRPWPTAPSGMEQPHLHALMGELGEDTRARVDEHLKTCEKCRTEMAASGSKWSEVVSATGQETNNPRRLRKKKKE